MKEAVRFLTPKGYKGSTPGADLESERKRLIAVTTPGPVAAASTSGAGSSRSPAPAVPATRAGYADYTPSAQPVSHQQQPAQTSFVSNPDGSMNAQPQPPQPSYGHTTAPSSYPRKLIDAAPALACSCSRRRRSITRLAVLRTAPRPSLVPHYLSRETTAAGTTPRRRCL